MKSTPTSPRAAIDIRSPYEVRLRLVVDVLTRNSTMGAAQASTLATDVLRAIDHIPERVR